MVRGVEMKASSEWVHLKHPRIKMHDGRMLWLKQRQNCICKNGTCLDEVEKPRDYTRLHRNLVEICVISWLAKHIRKNKCRLQPPRQPHTHLRRHRPKFIMNAPVKLQQHNAIYDSANRHRNQYKPDAGERHHQTVGANEQPHHR